MTLSKIVLAVTSIIATLGAAQAQTYPNQDLHMVVGFAAGSGPDIVARFLADKLRPKLGKPILVENKPGAVGNIATEYVAKAKPDGYTLYMTGGSTLAAATYLFKNQTADAKTLEVAATMASAPILMVVATSSPYQKLADLSAALRAKGDKASYGTAFPTARVAGAIYRDSIGGKAVEVQYKTSSDWINDLTGGNIDFAFIDATAGLGLSKAGRFRVIAVSTAKRSAAMPDFPTITEGGVKLDIGSWWAVFAPQGTPKPVLEKLHTDISDVVRTDEAKTFFSSTGYDTWITTADEARAAYLKEFKDWAEYVKIAKIEPQG
jgi:tripartite-type tricarboxylate transporter receptor subunit TctC